MINKFSEGRFFRVPFPVGRPTEGTGLRARSAFTLTHIKSVNALSGTTFRYYLSSPP